nr:retrovirus-related Pol polyprotein from transposon TNT 1-94 [Tanacetum cinerariifolium]
MSKTHFLLQKKLHELESEFTHVSNYLIKTTSGPNLIVDEFKHRLVFYRTLLTAETAVHKIKPQHLDGFEKRLAELETSFNNHYMFTKDSGKAHEVGNEAFEKFNEEVASLSDLEYTFDFQDLKIDYNTKHGFSVVAVWMMLGAILMGNPQIDLQDKGVIDSGCSRHMTWNMSYLTDYAEIDGGYVAFGGIPKEEKIMKMLGHLNSKTMNKLVKENLIRGTKDETTGILKSFIARIENLVDHKGILRQSTVARTPQQNEVAEKRNRTLIEAVKTMLADSNLPTIFWAEAVNTACYIQNKVLVVKPHNKTPYDLFHGRTSPLSFMRPFGCPVTTLNTKDHVDKFDGKVDEDFFVGYSLNSKAFRVFNSRTRIMEKNLHIRFNENTPNVVGSELDWLFDTDAITRTMNYEPIVAGTQSNGFAGTKASDNAGQARKETQPVKDYIFVPLWTADPSFS